MSETAQAATSGEPAPAATTATTAPAAQPAPAAPPQAATSGEDPAWLSPRLQREREATERRIATELGVSVAEAKQRLAALAKYEDEKKSAEDRAAERLAELQAARARAESLEAAVKQRATFELSSLTDAQRQAVERLANGDPAMTLSAIDTLKPTWTQPTPPSSPQPSADASPSASPSTPPPQPASTVPAARAPDGASVSPTDHKAEYARLKASNPFAAAAYLNRYARHIYPGS